MSPEAILAGAGKTIIGLTGNIATGKSAVMKLAAERGALAIDADRIVHHLQDNDPAVQDAIAALFGDGVRMVNGRIDRAAVGRVVFSDPVALRRLEAIMHPAVYRHVEGLIVTSEQAVVMIEAIKLLQGQFRPLCHQIWVTHCSRELQLQRLQICRGWERSMAESRVDTQDPQEEKVAQASVIIETNGLMRETAAQFDVAWARLQDAR